jgi:hypothetical protein
VGAAHHARSRELLALVEPYAAPAQLQATIPNQKATDNIVRRRTDGAEILFTTSSPVCASWAWSLTHMQRLQLNLGVGLGWLDDDDGATRGDRNVPLRQAG